MGFGRFKLNLGMGLYPMFRMSFPTTAHTFSGGSVNLSGDCFRPWLVLMVSKHLRMTLLVASKKPVEGEGVPRHQVYQTTNGGHLVNTTVLRQRFLDWTQSPFVAAFFAFSTERDPKVLPKDRVIYALAKQQIMKKTEAVKKTEPGTLLTGIDAIEIISPQVDDNMRLVSQRGLFTKSRIGMGSGHAN